MEGQDQIEELPSELVGSPQNSNVGLQATHELSHDEHVLDAVAPQTAEAKADFKRATLFGVVAGLLGAIIWASVVLLSQFKVGFIALLVGYMVGLAVKIGARHHDDRLGYLGAGLALFGCFMGDFFTSVGWAAKYYHVSYFQVLGNMDFELLYGLISAGLTPMDVVFFAIAIYEGYKFSVANK